MCWFVLSQLMFCIDLFADEKNPGQPTWNDRSDWWMLLFGFYFPQFEWYDYVFSGQAAARIPCSPSIQQWCAKMTLWHWLLLRVLASVSGTATLGSGGSSLVDWEREREREQAGRQDTSSFSSNKQRSDVSYSFPQRRVKIWKSGRARACVCERAPQFAVEVPSAEWEGWESSSSETFVSQTQQMREDGGRLWGQLSVPPRSWVTPSHQSLLIVKPVWHYPFVGALFPHAPLIPTFIRSGGSLIVDSSFIFLLRFPHILFFDGHVIFQLISLEFGMARYKDYFSHFRLKYPDHHRLEDPIK